MIPETHYAKTSDGYAAWQQFGEGALDLLFIPGYAHNIDVMWEDPRIERFLRELGAFARVLLVNLRGSGVADPFPEDHSPPHEWGAEDIAAVLNVAGVEKAALFAYAATSGSALMFAATNPERVHSLVLLDGAARVTANEDYPWGWSAEKREQWRKRWLPRWGRGAMIAKTAPNAAQDDVLRRWHARYERLSMSPKTFQRSWETNNMIDVRAVLPLVAAPTLVLRGTGGPSDEQVQHLAKTLPDARLTTLPAGDAFYFYEGSETLLSELRAWLTGTSVAVPVDRVLATVLFCDIVDSTRRASELGDAEWARLLKQFYVAIRRQLQLFRGREMDTAGDGLFATFDGPGRAIACARAMRDAATRLDLQMRIGVHAGECEVIGDKYGGIAVHTTARILGKAAAGEILVSGTLRDLVAGSGLEFVERGVTELKGVPGEWALYALETS